MWPNVKKCRLICSNFTKNVTPQEVTERETFINIPINSVTEYRILMVSENKTLFSEKSIIKI